MPSSAGKGLLRNVPRYAPWGALWDVSNPQGTAYFVSDDWYFSGRGPQFTTDIPWTWLSGPLRFRPDPPINAATVSTDGGSTALASDEASIDEYGQWPFTHSTNSADPKDAVNLADWIVEYYKDPRVRLAQVQLILNKRTLAECRKILRRDVGDRIHITGTPTGWPEGVTQLVIEGIAHRSAVDVRTVTWSLSPLIGESPDVAGPWFRLGVSQLGGTDVLPW
jgi:hypothetical protein